MTLLLLIHLLTIPDSARIIGNTRHSFSLGECRGNRVSVRDSRGWIHCVYSSGVGHPYATDVPSDIFYVFSIDNGMSWSRPMNISNIDTCNSDEPNLAIDSRDILHLVWRQFYETHDPLTRGEDLVYSRCVNGIWIEPINISKHPGTKTSRYSSLVIDSHNRPHVVYDRGTGSGNWDIFYSYLVDDTWSIPYNISQDPYDSAFPALAIDRNNHLHLVYRTRINNRPIMYSKYNGVFWTPPENITGTGSGWGASIVVDSRCNPHVFFGYAYYMTKTDSGWTPPLRISPVSDTSFSIPQAAIDSNDNLYFVCQGYLENVSPRREEIFCRTFNGTSWSPVINITQDTSRSWTPKIGNPIYSQGVDLTWLDLDPTQSYPWTLDVIYMRLNPISAAIEENRAAFSPLDLSLKVERRINPATTIFSIPDFQRVNLKLYDINGRLIQDLVNETKEPGIYKINLNTKGLSSGIYFLSLEAEKKRIIERLVVIK